MIPWGNPGRSRPLLAVLCVSAIIVVAAPAAAASDGPAPADTVRTNLWLTEALMADVVTAVMRVLPEPPRAILMAAHTDSPEDELFGAVATRQLLAAGYVVRVPVVDDPAKTEADTAAAAEENAPHAAGLAFSFRVTEVALTYPEVGRTLGVWRKWVDRELSVSILIGVEDRASGRVLLNDRVTRSYNDRVPGGDFDDVNSGMYEFTTAETSESAWQRRMEEIVVLGALAGLVAIYFANTSN